MFLEHRSCHYASAWVKIVERSGDYRMFQMKINREKECSYLSADKFYSKTGKFRYSNNPLPLCSPDEPGSLGNILHVMLFEPDRDWTDLVKIVPK
jgi:hypothetical protein